VERRFFYALDAELEKIETFYLEHEAAMHTRNVVLKHQLVELSGHRKVFHAANSPDWKSWGKLYGNKMISSLPLPKLPFSLPSVASKHDPEAQRGGRFERPTSVLSQHVKGDGYGEKSGGKTRQSKGSDVQQWQRSTDPEEYADARQKLKKAMIEHYRLVFITYT
jgi:xenotropic and polytropic retrovirus receptor 1